MSRRGRGGYTDSSRQNSRANDLASAVVAACRCAWTRVARYSSFRIRIERCPSAFGKSSKIEIYLVAVELYEEMNEGDNGKMTGKAGESQSAYIRRCPALHLLFHFAQREDLGVLKQRLVDVEGYLVVSQGNFALFAIVKRTGHDGYERVCAEYLLPFLWGQSLVFGRLATRERVKNLSDHGRT
ncbi:hypothetical protein SCHPADRAFT_933018, partial [Schizopora paradoxa]